MLPIMDDVTYCGSGRQKPLARVQWSIAHLREPVHRGGNSQCNLRIPARKRHNCSVCQHGRIFHACNRVRIVTMPRRSNLQNFYHLPIIKGRTTSFKSTWPKAVHVSCTASKCCDWPADFLMWAQKEYFKSIVLEKASKNNLPQSLLSAVQIALRHIKPALLSAPVCAACLRIPKRY